jgi:hypothetical protein
MGEELTRVEVVVRRCSKAQASQQDRHAAAN